MLLFNVFSMFLRGRALSIFQRGVRMAGKPFGGLNKGPSKIKEGGQGALPLISNLTHFASLCVFISAYPQYISGKGDETGGRFNCQAAGSLSRGSCCHAAILK